MAKRKSNTLKQGRNRVGLTRAIRKPTKPKKGRRLSDRESERRELETARLKRPPRKVVQR